MNDTLTSLERLLRLRESGVLTEQEFAAEKAKILDSREIHDAKTASTASTASTAPYRRARAFSPRAKVILAAALVLLVAAVGAWWWFSPYWTLREMQSAVAARDADALAKYIDFPSLRSDLKADAIAEIAKEPPPPDNDGADGLSMLGAAMVGPMIDAMVSPGGLRTLLAMKDPDGRDFGLMDAAEGGGEIVRSGLSEFKVEGAKGDVLVFSLNGLRWQLSGMDSPPSKPARPTAEATNAPASSGELQSTANSQQSAKSFGCHGNYSDVDFSSDDGDGEGVLARIDVDGDVKMTFWEGGPSVATVTTTATSSDRLGLQITFPDVSNQMSTGSLSCSGENVVFRSSDTGHDETLHPISDAEAAELAGE